MKSIAAILLIGCIMLLSSCDGTDYRVHVDNVDADEEVENPMFFTYKVIRSFDNEKKGIAIMVNKNGSEEYVLFDDEMSYNHYIHEWIRVLKVAEELDDMELDDEQINDYLGQIHCLPDCLKNIRHKNSKIDDAVLDTYYDWQDVKIYEPHRLHGSHTYPFLSPGQDDILNDIKFYIVLYRIRTDDYNVPIGTLAMDFDYMATFLLN